MPRLLSTLMLCWPSLTFAQQFYSYPFSGKIQNIEKLETELLQVEGVNSCKIRWKEEAVSGEILLDLKPYTKQEDLKNPDTLIQIKKIVLDSGLTPHDLVELKL
jgi:hypothetical protein